MHTNSLHIQWWVLHVKNNAKCAVYLYIHASERELITHPDQPNQILSYSKKQVFGFRKIKNFVREGHK